MFLLAICATLVTISSTLACVCLELYAKDLRNPLFMAHMPHIRHKFLVIEQLGVVQEFDGPNKPITKPFLDLRHKVVSSNSLGEERGLLGLAMETDFETTQTVYTYQIVNINGVEHSEISKHLRNGEEEILLRIPKSSTRYNGGMMLFGEDNKLYIFVGDNSQEDAAQNGKSLLGKVLRLDTSNKTIDRNYSIPDDNPFLNEVTYLPEIFSLGFMNPWRCSVDSGDPITGEGHGDIYCGETGNHDYDEINIIEKGGNYGWDLKEGNKCIKTAADCRNIANEKTPIYVYPHINRSASVIGGYMYRGFEHKDLQGKYIFGEALSGKIMSLTNTGNSYAMSEVPICKDANEYSSILSFASDFDGELYILTVNQWKAHDRSGTIFKIVPDIDGKCSGAPHGSLNRLILIVVFLHYVNKVYTDQS